LALVGAFEPLPHLALFGAPHLALFGATLSCQDLALFGALEWLCSFIAR
jgi:hypothetical protein